MLSGLLNMGQTALNASQAWISVTGSNIANADTPGYARRYVDQRDAGTITAKPGGESMGVNAQQILRFFDAFLERSYVCLLYTSLLDLRLLRGLMSGGSGLPRQWRAHAGLRRLLRRLL